MSAVRVLATRLNGDGTETFLDPEVPLSDIQVEPGVNQGTVIAGTITPRYLSQIAPDGRPFLEAWSTALYVEEDGQIIGGGILVEDSYNYMERSLTTVGFADYPAGQAFTGSWVSTAMDIAKGRVSRFPSEIEALRSRKDRASKALTVRVAEYNAAPTPPTLGTARPTAVTAAYWVVKKTKDDLLAAVANAQQEYVDAVAAVDARIVQHDADFAMMEEASTLPDMPTFSDGVDGVDPLDIFRYIWHHLQTQPRGNLGVIVDATSSPVRLGEATAAPEYDPENDGDTPEFESNEFRLAWYETTDLGSKITDLFEGTPFEFWEEHSWNANRTAIEHRLRLAYPMAGRIRNDVRFVIDENVAIPDWANVGTQDYASELMALGAGEGGTDISANESGRINALIHRDNEHRIRRCLPFDDAARSDVASLTSAARQQLKSHRGHYAVSNLTTIPGAGADLASVRPGDRILLLGDLGWVELREFYRVISVTRDLASNTRSFAVEPANSEGSPYSGVVPQSTAQNLAFYPGGYPGSFPVG